MLSPAPHPPEAKLLAIDLGLRTGFAAYDVAGRLLSYRSTRFPDRATLKRAVHGVLRDYEPLAWLVLEGDRDLGAIWSKVARKRGADILWPTPEMWRETTLLPRDRRRGVTAKRRAEVLAREIIEASSAPNPTSLTDDVAEAIVLGRWAAGHIGWAEPTQPK